MKTRSINKAFTLIELLAVIVILAIILAIAIPITINIIKKAQDSANKSSLAIYGKAVENAIAEYQMKHKDLPNFTDPEFTKLITYSGERVQCDVKIVKEDGKLYLGGCKIDGKEVDQVYGENKNSICKFKSYTTEEARESRNMYLPGTKYECEVKENTTYAFYVLSTDKDEKDNITNVNLIMDRNIHEDGNPVTAAYNGNTPWYYGDPANNSLGPVTAMNYLDIATKNWNNIPNINIQYDDEGGYYKGIYTSNNVTSIIGRLDQVTTYEDLKARLPYMSEVYDSTGLDKNKCTKDQKSCPSYLVDGLDFTADIYTNNNNISSISKQYGYWTLSTGASAFIAWRVSNSGSLFGCYYTYSNNNCSVHIGSNVGVRPVISAPVSYLG